MRQAVGAPAAVGHLLRDWRVKRRRSQLALALESGVSARHLSFIETGRSRPSPEVILALAEELQVPLRARNEMLQAGGYAPRYSETPFSAPDLASVRSSLQRLLDAHDPYPGVALDRAWSVVLANRAAERMMALLPDALRTPPLNMFRASLHPDGFAAHTANFGEWGSYLVGELERLCESSADAGVTALLEEVLTYPNVRALVRGRANPAARTESAVASGWASAAPALLIPCVLNLGGATLSMFTTLATLGSPRDVTLAELTVELFYPSDEATAAVLRAMG